MRGGANSGWRRPLAVALVGLWTVGFELLPNLHVALHDELPDHVHDGTRAPSADSGTRVRVSYAGEPHHADHHHQHAGSSGIAHELALHRPRPVSGELVLIIPSPPARSAHGGHSLAHRGLAVAQPAPAATLPAIVAVAMPAMLVAVGQAPRSLRPESQRVRGPPAIELATV